MVLLRPMQVTLGSLILICKEEAHAFSNISAMAFEELPRVIVDIEKSLKEKFQYDIINYMMLMMVDPQVHFHIFPRYEKERSFADKTCLDTGWPGVPELSHLIEFSDQEREELVLQLKKKFE